MPASPVGKLAILAIMALCDPGCAPPLDSRDWYRHEAHDVAPLYTLHDRAFRLRTGLVDHLANISSRINGVVANLDYHVAGV